MGAMTGCVRTTAAIGLASLILAPAASAQTVAETPEAVLPEYSATPTPTPTPTATPAPEGEPREEGQVGVPPDDAPRRVRRVYRDFRRDAIIKPCDHTLNTLRDTRDSVTDEFAEEFPDFVASVNAAIDERKATDCQALAEKEAAEKKAAAEDDESDKDAAQGTGGTTAGTGTGTGAGTGTTGLGSGLGATPTVAPLPIDPLPADPEATDESLAPEPLPPIETPAPLPEEVAPPAAPAPVAPAPVAPAAPATAPVAREPAAAPAPVYGLAAGGGLLALAGLAAPLLGARGGSRLAAFQHSWAEAGFRVRGIWQDFLDWLRVGR